jgi:PST family polysaccharide transporter
MAANGFGVWSLAVQSLLNRVLRVVLAFSFSRWTPRFHYSRASIADLFGFSANLFGFNFINYWARNSDNLLVGKFIGSVGLGIYTRAYSLMLLPISQVISVINGVMFPTLASIQDDKPRVKRIYLRAMRMITLVTFPMMAGLFVVAQPFVLTLLGPRWAEDIPILQILCVVGLSQALCNPTGWIYQSQGRTDWMFRWGLAGSGTLVVSIVVGTMLGSVRSVAWAYMIGNLLIFYPCIMIPGKLIDMKVSDVLREVGGAFVCSVIMAALVWAFGRALPAGWPQGAYLAAEVALGGAFYLGLMALISPRILSEIRGLVAEQRARKRSFAATRA